MEDVGELPVVHGVAVAMAGVRLAGRGRVHVPCFRPSAHRRFGGIMLHGGHGGPGAGALWSC